MNTPESNYCCVNFDPNSQHSSVITLVPAPLPRIQPRHILFFILVNISLIYSLGVGTAGNFALAAAISCLHLYTIITKLLYFIISFHYERRMYFSSYFKALQLVPRQKRGVREDIHADIQCK